MHHKMNVMEGRGLDISGSGWCQMSSCREQGNECFSMYEMQFLDWWREY